MVRPDGHMDTGWVKEQQSGVFPFWGGVCRGPCLRGGCPCLGGSLPWRLSGVSEPGDTGVLRPRGSRSSKVPAWGGGRLGKSGAPPFPGGGEGSRGSPSLGRTRGSSVFGGDRRRANRSLSRGLTGSYSWSVCVWGGGPNTRGGGGGRKRSPFQGERVFPISWGRNRGKPPLLELGTERTPSPWGRGGRGRRHTSPRRWQWGDPAT